MTEAITDVFDRTVCELCATHVNERLNFVAKCGELLTIAKQHLIKCEFVLGESIKSKYPEYENCNYFAEYVVVSCKNGYTYKIRVEGISLIAIAKEIFARMAHK